MKIIPRVMKLVPTFLAGFFLFAFAGSSAYAQPVGDIISLVENHYGGVKTMTAQVVQKNFLRSMDKTQQFEGTLWIKKPGKLPIDYTNGQVILVDGKSALFYSRKSEQMIKKTFADVQQMNIPVAFLLGAAHIRDDFDVLQPDPKSPRFLELLPRKPGAAMKKLVLTADENGRITALTIFDRSGNTTEITLSEVNEGVVLDDKQFSFKAPKGTEVIEE